MPRAKKPVPFWAKYISYLKLHRRQAIGAGIGLVILLALAFPLRAFVVPALVNGQPIFSWNYFSQLHRQAGQQVLEQMINEALIEQEIAKQGIQVTQAEIDQEIASITGQLGSESGGIDALLAYQGITKSEFTRQVRLQLAMEKLVKGTIQITDEQIAQELKDNPTAYRDLSAADAATTAATNLRNSQLREAFNTWFDTLRAGAKVQNFFASPPLKL